MTPFKTTVHIHSLKREMDEITVLEKVGENDYIVDYKGVKCHALFNWFVCQFYADDIYRVVKEDEFDISAFDTEALAVLDEMFGSEITLR